MKLGDYMRMGILPVLASGLLYVLGNFINMPSLMLVMSLLAIGYWAWIGYQVSKKAKLSIKELVYINLIPILLVVVSFLESLGEEPAYRFSAGPLSRIYFLPYLNLIKPINLTFNNSILLSSLLMAMVFFVGSGINKGKN